MIRPPCSSLAVLLFLFVCAYPQANRPPAKIRRSTFGKTKEGEEIRRYVLTNHRDIQASVINYGAALVSLRIPDRDGKMADVVLGYDTLKGYEQDKSYFGATIGRYGNRIARAQFALDGTVFHLPTNDGPNCLHGGTRSFNKRVWTGADRSRSDALVLELSYTSQDGEEGFPGRLQVKVAYTLPLQGDELQVEYWATTDKDTVVNLTNHSYFNLSGVMSREILDHQLLLHASKFTPVDAHLIPTGDLQSVEGSPFDFRSPTAIGARIDQENEQLKYGRGYDHNWVLEGFTGNGLQPAAEVFEPGSGRVLEIVTTEPGIQFYSGNFLDGTARGKGGVMYAHRTGFCLETQHFPDSPNHPNFPSTVLKAGQSYRSITVFRFSTRR
jgi:aldose 1-epimerase